MLPCEELEALCFSHTCILPGRFLVQPGVLCTHMPVSHFLLGRQFGTIVFTLLSVFVLFCLVASSFCSPQIRRICLHFCTRSSLLHPLCCHFMPFRFLRSHHFSRIWEESRMMRSARRVPGTHLCFLFRHFRITLC